MAIDLTNPVKVGTGKTVPETKDASKVRIDYVAIRMEERAVVVEYSLKGSGEVLKREVVTLPKGFIDDNKAALRNFMKKIYEELAKLPGLSGAVGDDV